jgi:tetratricopeptide (TPR) repeat protein
MDRDAADMMTAGPSPRNLPSRTSTWRAPRSSAPSPSCVPATPAMAEGLCRDALAEFPGESNLASLLGAALNRLGRGPEAEPLLRHALDEEPNYAKGHEELGRSLLQQGRADEAIDSLRRAVGIEPKLQSAQLALVQALGDAGARRRGADGDGILPPGRSGTGADRGSRPHHSAGRLEAAEGLYREVLRRDPRNLEALRLLAVIAIECEHYGQAEQLLKRAVEIAPDFLAAWVDLARAQAERFDLQAALASLQRADLLNPRSAQVQLQLASVLARCRPAP